MRVNNHIYIFRDIIAHDIFCKYKVLCRMSAGVPLSRT